MINVVSSTIPNKDIYSYNFSSTFSFNVPVFTVNENNCGNDNIYYKLTISSNNGQSTSMFYISNVYSSYLTIKFKVTSSLEAGIYTITLSG